jgi:hypothetical protein
MLTIVNTRKEFKMRFLQCFIAIVAAWMILVMGALCVICVNTAKASGDAPLIRQDFERGLEMAKGLPFCMLHGRDIRELHQLDWTHPELRAWSAYVEDQFFSGEQLYINLVHAFTLVQCNARTGAHLSAVSLLRSIMAHDDFKKLMQDCWYFLPSV